MDLQLPLQTNLSDKSISGNNNGIHPLRHKQNGMVCH